MGNDHLRLANVMAEKLEVDKNAGDLTASIQRFVEILPKAAAVLRISVSFIRRLSRI